MLERAKTADNDGARRLTIRQLMFAEIGVDEARLDPSASPTTHWRGTRRRVEVRFGNVRDPADITDGALRPTGEDWCVVLDYPFDEASYSPADDRARVETGGRATPRRQDDLLDAVVLLGRAQWRSRPLRDS